MNGSRLFELVTTSWLAYHVFSFLTAACVLVEAVTLLAWYIEFLNSRDNGSVGPAKWIPYLAVVLVAAPLPVAYAVCGKKYRLRVERARQGRCLTCGYDLRATPDRCPECGKSIGTAVSDA